MASDLDRAYVINGDDLRIALSGGAATGMPQLVPNPRDVAEISERAEPYITAEGRYCVCGCGNCEGAYAHCLQHGTGCHLMGPCGWKPGMLLCAETDPDRKGAGAGIIERFAGRAAS